MATFKVGQRVKRVRAWPDLNLSPDVPLGAEGVVTGLWNGGAPLDGHAYYFVRRSGGYSGNGMLDESLAPLTDPKADEFVRRVTEPLPVLCQGDIGEHQRTPYKWPAKV
jgi:hypothetical protein